MAHGRAIPPVVSFGDWQSPPPATPDEHQRCHICGRPTKAPEVGICLACRLLPGLATAAEIFTGLQAQPHRSESSGLDALCRDHPATEDQWRHLREAAKSRPEHGQPALGWPPGGRYEILGEIARGGMGIIYAAQDRELKREVAMKVIGTHVPGTVPMALEALPAAWVDRFVEEAQITAQLDHPNIVPVHDLGIDPQGRLYFVMKRVNGRALNEMFALARKGSEGWSLARAVGALTRACEGVAHAHERGVVHRDLKPQNIMVGRSGEVYVIDWGLAHAASRADLHDLRLSVVNSSTNTDTRPGQRSRDDAVLTTDSPLVTLDGAILGTPVYMSPEHAAGRTEEIGAASDVYSLGTILYELLAGQPPYLRSGERKSPIAVLEAVRAGPPDPIERIARDQPAELLAICAKAMQWDAGARYRNAGELTADLQAWLDHRVVRTPRTGALAKFKGRAGFRNH